MWSLFLFDRWVDVCLHLQYIMRLDLYLVARMMLNVQSKEIGFTVCWVWKYSDDGGKYVENTVVSAVCRSKSKRRRFFDLASSVSIVLCLLRIMSSVNNQDSLIFCSRLCHSFCHDWNFDDVPCILFCHDTWWCIPGKLLLRLSVSYVPHGRRICKYP